jgi:hypothetical protein
MRFSSLEWLIVRDIGQEVQTAGDSALFGRESPKGSAIG